MSAFRFILFVFKKTIRFFAFPIHSFCYYVPFIPPRPKPNRRYYSRTTKHHHSRPGIARKIRLSNAENSFDKFEEEETLDINVSSL